MAESLKNMQKKLNEEKSILLYVNSFKQIFAVLAHFFDIDESADLAKW